MSIDADLQQLASHAVMTFFVLDLLPIDATVTNDNRYFRFCADRNELGNNLVWQGHEYTAYPIECDGFEVSAKGTMPHPTIKAANLNGVLSALCLQYQDLVGAQITRKRTFSHYLDAVNFSGGNPSADSNQHFQDDVFFINRKTLENRLQIEWELRWAFDLEGVMIPRRQIVQNVCAWRYQSGECGWVPVAGKYYDALDQHQTGAGAAGLDQCGKRLQSCKLRFGAKAVLPFGGFPAAGLTR